MFNTLKKFLDKIRNSDEKIKKRWLIGLSATAMIIVVALWLAFLNVTAKKTNVVEQETPEIGFWQIFKNGISIIGDSSGEKIKNLFSKINAEIKSNR